MTQHGNAFDVLLSIEEEENAEPQPLRPVQLWYACALTGWFLDRLRIDPEEAMRYFGEPTGHPLRGCFEPRARAPPVADNDHYQSLSSAIYGTKSTNNPGSECLTHVQFSIASFVFVLCSPITAQLYAWTMLKNSCEEFGGWRCQTFHFLDDFGAAYVCVAALLMLLIIRVAFALCWGLFKRCCRVKALEMARFMTVKMLDKVALEKLPNTVGKREQIVIWGVSALFASFSAMAVIDMNVGILAFGQLLAVYMLLSGNAIFGDMASLDMVRERHILDVCERVARDAKIDLTSSEVRTKVSEWYRTNPSFDAIVVDLPILTLLANLIWFPADTDPESIRLRRFIVPQMFVTLSQTGLDSHGDWGGYVTGFKDVVVDVFSRSCIVLDYDHSGSRWAAEGERLPWHFSLHPGSVAAAQADLRELGLLAGAGCFSPAPFSGLWEASETERPFESLEKKVKDLMSKQANLTSVLSAYLKAADEDTVDMTAVKAFIRAGASANVEDVATGVKERPQLLFQCMNFYAAPQALDVCYLLIDMGSNLESRCFGPTGNGDMTLFERQLQKAQDEIARGQGEARQALVEQLKEYVESTRHLATHASKSKAGAKTE